MRTPWDLALALLDRAGRLRPECLFDDRRLERERTVRPLRVGELLKLLKLDEIQLFLVQVRSQLRHRGQDQKCDQRENTERAVYLENYRYHLAPGLSGPAQSINDGLQVGILSSDDVDCYPAEMGRCFITDSLRVVPRKRRPEGRPGIHQCTPMTRIAIYCGRSDCGINRVRVRHLRNQSRFRRVTPAPSRMSRFNLRQSCPSPWDSYA
jgi:hypothetical protein